MTRQITPREAYDRARRPSDPPWEALPDIARRGWVAAARAANTPSPTSARSATAPAPEPVSQPVPVTPQPGDLVRVTRTSTEVFEGYWVEADDKTGSGHHALDVPGTGWEGLRSRGFWMRVRDQGPVEYGSENPNGYTEADIVEVLEARHGAPYDDARVDETAAAVPVLSPALTASRRRFNLAFGTYLAFAFVASLVVLSLFTDDLRAEFGRVGTALVLILAFSVTPGVPFFVWARRNDRAVKRELAQ